MKAKCYRIRLFCSELAVLKALLMCGFDLDSIGVCNRLGFTIDSIDH